MSVTTESETLSLTADDLAALRTADNITFHRYKGRGFIRVYLRDGFSDEVIIYTARQQRLFPITDWASGGRGREISVSHSVVSGYDDDERWHGDADATGFASVSSCKYTPTWVTTVGVLRVSDVLEIHFDGDAHSNGYTKPLGLHADVCRLIVRRGDAKLTFIVATSICPNNSARMVHRINPYLGGN